MSIGNSFIENLYSRQTCVYGIDSMKKMFNCKVLISGMDGLGVEIAKNIVLIGMRNLTIHDQFNVTVEDLGTQYFLSESDIGKNRASCTQSKLSELNSLSTINVLTERLSDEYLNEFDVVVMVNPVDGEFKHFAEFCHEKNKKFLLAESRGVFGKIFCDFGDNFTVYDQDGRDETSSKVKLITQDGVVEVFEDDSHSFQDNDYVRITNVKGMENLNNKEFLIKKINPFKFSIADDLKQYDFYKSGGIATLVKKPKICNFKSYKSALSKPDYAISDFTKMADRDSIHLSFEALYGFVQAQKRSPKPWNEEDAHELFNIAQSFNSKLSTPFENINEDLMKLFSYVSAGQLSPVNSFIGGVVAQEVMKSCTGKFNPIYQFLYFDCRECLSETPNQMVKTYSDKLIDESNRRYMSQIVVFGEEFQEKLKSLNYFLVGAGALGCEYLKQFAMMGVGCGRNGKVTVTDNDTISVSNLSRQFLFRPTDVGKLKSRVAEASTKKMNPSLNLIAESNYVGEDSVQIYNDHFFESLDGVCNALDNHEARVYIDQKCVYYGKPLIESGTNGCKGSTQCIIPHLTESYSTRPAEARKEIPMCTIKQAPYLIEHTIAWARDIFEGVFKNAASVCEQYVKNSQEFKQKKLSQENVTYEIQELYKTIKSAPRTFEDCVKWAREFWQQCFHDDILTLLEQFPPDFVTEEGVKYWSGVRKYPKELYFDIENDLNLKFIQSTANLRAYMYGLKQEADLNKIKHMLTKISDEKNTTENTDLEDVSSIDDINLLFDKLSIVDEDQLNFVKSIRSAEFEKDDDTNFHIDFIESGANLRALNYSIPTEDRYKIKLIAGRIIPALATTTSAIVGLCCIELYKIVQGHKELKYFKNSAINLARCFFAMGPLISSPKIKYLDKTYTIWDRIEIREKKTLSQLFEYFILNFKLKIFFIIYKEFPIYNSFSEAENLNEELSIVIAKKVFDSQSIPEYLKSLELIVSFMDESDSPILMPNIKYIL